MKKNNSMLVMILVVVAMLMVILPRLMKGQPKEEQSVVTTPSQEIRLSVGDVSQILNVAVKDIEKQGCEPLFLNESGPFIWVRCKDGFKVYRLDKLIEAYQAQKEKAKETPDVKMPDRD